MKALIYHFLLLTLAPAVSVAQMRTARFLSSADGKQPTCGHETISVSDAGVVTVWSADLAHMRSFATGVTVPGAYEVIGQNIITDVLVAGRNPSGGRLEHWSLNPISETWALTSGVSLPGDFTGIAFDGSALFLLESQTKTILFGPWSVSHSLGALLASAYLTQTQLPALANAERQFLFDLSAGSAPSLPGPGLFLVDQMAMMGHADLGVLIREVNGVTVSEEYLFDPLPGTLYPVADESTAYDGATTLTVDTCGNTTFEVVDPQGGVIGTGCGPAGGGPVQVPLTQALAIGGRYIVRGIGSSNEATFVCVRRHGFPEAFADGSRMSRIMMSPADYYVGNHSFSVTTRVSRSWFAGPRVAYSGIMIVGFDGSAVVDLDNGQGTNQFLVSDYWTGANGFIPADADAGFIEMSLPIPNDPALEGTLILGQFAIVDGSQYRLSEVIGYKVRQAP